MAPLFSGQYKIIQSPHSYWQWTCGDLGTVPGHRPWLNIHLHKQGSEKQENIQTQDSNSSLNKILIKHQISCRRLFVRLTYIAFPVPETDMCYVLSRPVRCTCAQSVHTHYIRREIPTPGRLRPELPVPESAWVCEMRNYWLLNGFMDTHYTWKVCRIKVFMWRWVRFGGRHIETLFIDS